MLRLFLPLFLLATPALAQVPAWQVDHAQSRLGFVADQSGGDVEGYFERWSAEILFDPENLAGSVIAVEIEMASVATGSSDQEGEIKGEGLFHVEAFPLGAFRSLEIIQTAETAYEARGELTLRETTKEVMLPFTLTVAGEEAAAAGGLTIERLDYGIGRGDWLDTSLVADTVEIVFEIKALRTGE